MRENTGRQIVTTANFTDVPVYGLGVASHDWTAREIADTLWVIDAYADQHRASAYDTEHVLEFGYPQVFEYEEAGLRVVVLLHDGQVDTVFSVEDADTARYHTAARTGRTMKIRYVKPTEGAAEVSIREIEVTSVRLTKAGHVNVRAHDRRKDDGRTFRADRITHSTLHRVSAPSRPSKAALAAAFQARTPSATVTIPAPRTEQETVEIITDIYSTEPGYAASLEAPEAVQDLIAERYALGHAYAFVTV